MRFPYFSHTSALATLFFACAAVAAAESSEKPNIILVMADDMGWGRPVIAITLC